MIFDWPDIDFFCEIKNIFFYNCISSLGILSLAGPFIVVCSTATVSLPIHRFLADSHQRRIFLPIT